MKKILLLTLIFMAGILFTCCDKIDPPYMVEVNSNPVDTTAFTFPLDTIHFRVALLEEFTGHTCNNCPTAAVEVDNLENHYSDSLVVISYHTGMVADPFPPDFPENFHAPVGDSLNDIYFNIQSAPSAVIDRRRNTTDTMFAIEPWSNWGSVISTELDSVPIVDIQMINVFKIDSPYTVKIHIQTEFLVNVNHPLKLCVYVTEDDITGNQANGNSAVGTVPIIHNYHFMNMFRAAITSLWGNVINDAPVTAGTNKYFNYDLTINNKWNHDNCHIVAFISDGITKKVLVAIKRKVEP